MSAVDITHCADAISSSWRGASINDFRFANIIQTECSISNLPCAPQALSKLSPALCAHVFANCRIYKSHTCVLSHFNIIRSSLSHLSPSGSLDRAGKRRRHQKYNKCTLRGASTPALVLLFDTIPIVAARNLKKEEAIIWLTEAEQVSAASTARRHTSLAARQTALGKTTQPFSV
jgi:hypothetical protein